nr:bifunctional riboflavin kinase/FAD synthetase [Corynebacterium pseudogenitalium]
MHVDILHGLNAVPESFGALDGTVLTIGVFDGVHRGHQMLIKAAVDEAKRLQVPCVVMTFEPHPVAVFRPEAAPTALMPLEERARLIAELGVDALIVIDFRKELAGESAQDYFGKIVMGTLHARHVFVGENFTFGRDASGTSQTMVQLGEQNGVDVTVVRLLKEGATRICSTAIRDELAQGNISVAKDYMGRPFSVVGPIERGAGRGGRELGYPTANQYVADVSALPKDGVYAGWLTIIDDAPIGGNMVPGKRYPAAISVGTNPTFGDKRRSVESYVLDRDADLYDRMARVEFVAKVRDMVKFDSVDELLEHMARDVSRTRELLSEPVADSVE